MTENDKPPIGLMPSGIFFHNVNKQRLQDITDAMIRYLQAGYEIPQTWFDEYDSLRQYLKKGNDNVHETESK